MAKYRIIFVYDESRRKHNLTPRDWVIEYKYWWSGWLRNYAFDPNGRDQDRLMNNFHTPEEAKKALKVYLKKLAEWWNPPVVNVDAKELE